MAKDLTANEKELVEKYAKEIDDNTENDGYNPMLTDILTRLIADHAPTPTANEKELVERAWKSIPIYNCRVVDRGGVPFDVIDNGRLITRDDFHNILTRFLSEVRRDGVDAEKLERLLLQWEVFKKYLTDILFHEGRRIDWSQGHWNEIESRFMDLRAAIKSAGGGK